MLYISLILAAISWCLMFYGSFRIDTNISGSSISYNEMFHGLSKIELDKFTITRPSIDDLPDECDKSIVYKYTTNVITKFNEYVSLLKNYTERDDSPVALLTFTLLIFHGKIICEAYAFTFPELAKWKVIVYGIITTVALVFICYMVVSKISHTPEFKRSEADMTNEYYELSKYSSVTEFPISEKQAISNYMLEQHYDFLDYNYRFEKRRYHIQIAGIVIGIILMVIWLLLMH